MLKDMLQEKGKWSQGRVYLLVSVIVYYITLGFLMVAGLHKSNNDLDLDKFKIIIEALEYAMVLFGGYVFGGKFLDVVKVFGGKKEDPPKEPNIG
jgi:hypothetical protein|tara:strand:- start:360 stop:644 length:285 start_codon:yes stop_codon:yes gene_type:complete